MRLHILPRNRVCGDAVEHPTNGIQVALGIEYFASTVGKHVEGINELPPPLRYAWKAGHDRDFGNGHVFIEWFYARVEAHYVAAQSADLGSQLFGLDGDPLQEGPVFV